MTSARLFNPRLTTYAGGAPTDGVTDAYPAIRAAVTAAIAQGNPTFGSTYRDGSTVYLPYCKNGYVLSQPLIIEKARGFRLIADKGTVITYTGSSSTYGIIQMEGYGNTVAGISFVGSATTGVRMWHTTPVTPPYTWISSFCTFQDLEFSGSFTNCLGIDVQGGTMAGNNEYHRVLRCVFRNYGDKGVVGAGVYIFGSQSHGNRINWNQFYGNERGSTQYGIYADYGCHQHIEFNEFYDNLRDIYLEDFFQVFSIKSNVSRNSSRFAQIGGGAAPGPGAGVVSGNDVDHGSYLGSPDPLFGNPYVSIYITYPGPISIDGNDIRATNANPMIRGFGTEYGGVRGPTIGGNRFRGSSNYFAPPTSFTAPTGATQYQACMDYGGSNVRYVTDRGTNKYYNHTSGTYETLTCPTVLECYGMMSDDAPDVVPQTYQGYTDFVDGSAQTQNGVLRMAEADTGYRSGVTSVCALNMFGVVTGNPPDGIKAHVEAGQTTTDFPIRLSAAPVGWGVRVFWKIWRTG